MPFCPKQLTQSTLKGFVDRLHRYAKQTAPEGWDPKRSWAQEAVARSLGFPNYHTAQLAIAQGGQPETQPQTPDWMICPAQELAGHSPHLRIHFSAHPSQHMWGIDPSDVDRDIILIGNDADRARSLVSLVGSLGQRPVLLVHNSNSPISHTQLINFGVSCYPHAPGPAEALDWLIKNGNAGEIVEALVGYFTKANDGNAMWVGRAISMVSAVMGALVFLRKDAEFKIDLNRELVADYLGLENVVLLSKRENLPSYITQSLTAYLRSLPGYQKDAFEQHETVLDHHGYLQMQFTRLLREPMRNPGFEMVSKIAFPLGWEELEGQAEKNILGNWARKHRGGIIILDGLGKDSVIYQNLLPLKTHIEAHGHRVVVGLDSIDKFPLPGGAKSWIQSRQPHWAVLGKGAEASAEVEKLQSVG